MISNFLRKSDTIDLSRIDAGKSDAGNQAFDFIGRSTFTEIGQLNYSKQSGSVVIYGNTDADIEAEFEIWISGAFTPRDSDLIL